MIRLLDLPNIASIENKVTLDELTGVKDNHDLDRLVEVTITSVFGVEPWSEYDFGVEYYEAKDDDDGVRLTMSDEAWAKAGWDVRDAAGKTLRCLPRFAESLAAVTLGVASKTVLEIEREAWQRARQARPGDAQQRKRAEMDRSFASLGGRGRRRA